MHINDALYSYLSTYAGLTALTSNRIYPDNLPQNPTLPAITYVQLSGNRIHAFQQDTGLTYPTYQFTCWGTSRKSAKTTATELRKALQNYNGLMGGASGVNVSGVLILDESDDFDSETKLYNTYLDFEIWHQE